MYALLSNRKNFILQIEAKDVLRHLSVGGEAEKYAAEARYYCFNRYFLMTFAGRMDIGPSDTKIDDVVCVIPGNGVPYIIRPRIPSS